MLSCQPLIQESLNRADLLTHDFIVTIVDYLKTSGLTQWCQDNNWNVHEYIEGAELIFLKAVDSFIGYLKHVSLFEL